MPSLCAFFLHPLYLLSSLFWSKIMKYTTGADAGPTAHESANESPKSAELLHTCMGKR